MRPVRCAAEFEILALRPGVIMVTGEGASLPFYGHDALGRGLTRELMERWKRQRLQPPPTNLPPPPV